MNRFMKALIGLFGWLFSLAFTLIIIGGAIGVGVESVHRRPSNDFRRQLSNLFCGHGVITLRLDWRAGDGRARGVAKGVLPEGLPDRVPGAAESG